MGRRGRGREVVVGQDRSGVEVGVGLMDCRYVILPQPPVGSLAERVVGSDSVGISLRF